MYVVGNLYRSCVSILGISDRSNIGKWLSLFYRQSYAYYLASNPRTAELYMITKKLLGFTMLLIGFLCARANEILQFASVSS